MTREECIAILKEIVVIANEDKKSSILADRLTDIINFLQEPSLPVDLDEAARQFQFNEYRKWCAYREKYATILDAFKAGAEWMAGQGVSVTAITGIKDGITEDSLDALDDFVRKANPKGTEVIIQIRKK